MQIESNLNQISVTALPDWELLHQVSENAILHPIIYCNLENYSVFTSLPILSKNQEY